MESEQHPPSSSSLLTHEHDFSSLVSWPYHWQPESFEITTNTTSNLHSNMTQVVPEHVARAKLSGGNGNNPNTRKENTNNSTQKARPQRSNSATLSTISVTCDTDTSIKSRSSRPPQPVVVTPSKKSSNLFRTTNNMTASNSTSALTNVSIVRSNFVNNPSQKQRQTSSSMTSDINVIHDKTNKHLIKTQATTMMASASALSSARNLSMKHKSTSLDDHRSTRGLGKSVLEHLVFVFPENVRRILAGPKKYSILDLFSLFSYNVNHNIYIYIQY